MKKQILICSAFFAMIAATMSLQGSHAQQPADELIGTWKNSSQNMSVRVFKQFGKYHAEILATTNAADVGKRIIWELSYDVENREWSNGYVQLPSMNHLAKCYVKMENHDEAIITGYHGVRLLGSTQRYQRIPDSDPAKRRIK